MENPQELQSLVLALGPREEAIKRGMILQRQRYEVCKESRVVLLALDLGANICTWLSTGSRFP